MSTDLERRARRGAIGIVLALGAAATSSASPERTLLMTTNEHTGTMLTTTQQAIVPIAALAAAGDIGRLRPALDRGLDAGLTVGDTKEILVQLYAYAGFPRSLNALAELMKVVDARKQRGIDDRDEPSQRPVPTGDALLAAGTANQTRLSGGPVTGALFEFAPLIDRYLKAHLFGDIFERDLDWRTRELATVSMLSALHGVESQLQAHVRIAVNVGLSEIQLRQLADALDVDVDPEAGRRVREALAHHAKSSGTK